MDFGEMNKFGLEKRSEDHLNYHTCNFSSEWQFGNQSLDPLIRSQMASSSPCPSVSMVDSFCPGLYDNHPTNPQNSIGKPLSMDWNPGILPPSLSQFPADSGFIERAARFSCFSRGNFSAVVSNSFAATEPLSPYSSVSKGLSGDQSPMNHQRDNKGSNNMSGEPEFSGDGREEAPNSSSGGIDAKKRKRTNKDMVLDQGQGATQLSIGTTKENLDTKRKGEENSSTMAKPSRKNAKDGSDGPKEDYIHVRAQRGQATNKHSLAERVRREKISERMKFLQDLVPGCSKVTGKAVMLDEIINYVQSLQRQVEFLSMKLAAMNQGLEFNIGLLSKDILHLKSGSSSAIGFTEDMIYPQLHPSQQGFAHWDALHIKPFGCT